MLVQAEQRIVHSTDPAQQAYSPVGKCQVQQLSLMNSLQELAGSQTTGLCL
jgi:hypothetical protein